jgi:methyl-accepting chemotaxis protein
MGQAGENVSTAVKLTDQAGGAFRDIAEKAQGSAGCMASVQQAVAAMHDASDELEQAIAEAVATTDRNRQAAETMSQLNNQMVASLEAVGAVVEENTASTEQMAAGSSEVAQAVESIASVSEENSAAVEEVSASAEEMSAQVEEVTASAQSLAEMAQALQQMVARFKLSDTEVVRQLAAKGNGHGNGQTQAALQMTPGGTRRAAVQPRGGNGHRQEAAQREGLAG